MKKFWSICAAAIVACCLAAPASQATTVTATWTGTIRGGNDSAGIFGGTLDAGTAFSLVSVFDTALGTYAGAGGGSITGGGIATLTANGHAFTFSQPPSSYKFDALGNIQLFIGDTLNTFLSSAFFATGLPASILTPFSKDCFGDGFCSGTFEIVTGGPSSGAAFDVTHLSVSVATTPIPASLPLLVSALAGLGLMAKRRKATASERVVR